MFDDAHFPRKFLVVVDGTPEARVALRWAERRAQTNDGTVLLVAILEPGGFEHWLGVESLMKEEAREEAELILAGLANEVIQATGRKPQTDILEGNKIDEVLKLIESDKTISSLVLASAIPPEEPGPLIAALATGRVRVAIPVTIVPGELSEEEIDALT